MRPPGARAHPPGRAARRLCVTSRALLLALPVLSGMACVSEPPVTTAAPAPTTTVPAPPLAVSAVAPRSAEPAAAAAPVSAIRYLALGDSFTAGTGSRPDDAFPVRLAVRLRARGAAVTLENLGVNGYTTDDLVARELPRLAPFAPTLVTLAIGANDLVHGSPLERYRVQVRGILAAILAAGVPAERVFVLPQPDWSRSPVAADFGAPRAIQAKIEAFNEALQAEAAAVGARWVDLFPAMQREAAAGMIASDGLHPAARAYDEWAEALFGRVMPR
jgi:acyl-CoA thioesterase I